MSTYTYNYGIVGAGLAGCMLAQTLLQRGIQAEEICILDAEAPKHSTSKGPGFLLNPLPGRSLVPKPGYIEAYTVARQQWKQCALRADAYTEAPLLRPLLPEHKGSQRLVRSLLKAQDGVGPHIHLEHLSSEQTRDYTDLLQHIEGSILVEPAACLWPQKLFSALFDSLQISGVALHFPTRVEALEASSSGWKLRTSTEDVVTQNVILATGGHLHQLAPQHTYERVGGALIVARPPQGIQLNCMLSGAGVHIAPRTDGCWIIGATYEPSEQPSLSNQERIERMWARAEAFLPSIHECTVEDVWEGVRLVEPTHKMPVYGELPDRPGLFVMGAFGSKGLLMIPWVAQQVANMLLRNAS